MCRTSANSEEQEESVTDHLNRSCCEHSGRGPVAQRLFAPIFGYEEVNDHDSLLALALGRADVTRINPPRERCRCKAGSDLSARLHQSS